MNRFFKIFSRIIGGIFLFYLLMGFIIVPFVFSIVIKNEGTRFLKHPVSVRSVQFNPIFWQMSINGLTISDEENNLLIGFDQLKVDVSFLSLLKRIYRIELVSLDGLKINTELLSDGHINLLDLILGIPTPSAASSNIKTTKQEMPLVIVDLIHLSHGTIQFIDKTSQPNFTSMLTAMDITITGFTTRPNDQTKFIFQSKLDDKGSISSEVLIRPLKQPLDLEATLTIDKYAMEILSPYTRKYAGRDLNNGKFDFRMDYRIVDNNLTANHKALIQDFTFGDKVESKDALSLPFGLVVALLEDPQGRINISLPVTGDLSDPQFHFWHVIRDVVSNFFIKIITKPFTIFASVMGSGENSTDEWAFVRFIPGEADLTDGEKLKLVSLSKSLNERPKLSLVINGGYDPLEDWKAIKERIFIQEFAQLKQETTRDENWVYQELYQRRFGVRALWSLTGKYKLKTGGYDSEKLNPEIQRQIINEGKADIPALESLAHSRTELICEYIISSGFDKNRIEVGKFKETQASMGFVPTEFTLSVVGMSE